MKTLFPLCLLLALAGCGTLWPSVTFQAPSNQDALACVTEQAKSLGYYVSWTDRRTGLDATREIEDVEHRSYEESKRYDVLAVRASGKGSGGAPEFRVEARSFAERMTRRGPTRMDQYASSRVKSDAQTLADRCGGTAPAQTMR